jgi:DNA-binding transcriptional LysR family regulator
MFAWDDLKYFLAFARTGSLLAAARALGVNQSTVQRRIAELERRLGHKLVTRHLTGYRLTELGEALSPSAIRVEEAVTTFARDLAARDTGLSGVLRVTAPDGFANRLMESRLIDAFQVRYPGLRVELIVSDRVFDLSKGEADIAIRTGNSRDDDLIERKIGDAAWAIFASSSYIERHGAPRCVEDLNHHSIVTCAPCPADDPATHWLRVFAPAARVVVQCDSSSGLIQAVKSGAGVAPMMVYQEDNDLLRVIDTIDLVTPFYLLMHGDMRHAPRVRAFADFVGSEIKSFRKLISARVGSQFSAAHESECCGNDGGGTQADQVAAAGGSL